MYLDYYQLRAKPFQITADPKFLWLGDKHKEALATLRYGIVDNRGFLLLTGEVGTGKTLLINRLCSLLDIDTVVATLPDPDLNSMDFYNLLADGLQMKRTFDSKGAFLIHLRDFLHQSHADQKQVLLIIDESQRLNHKLMEDIRVLSNIELQDRKLINIFFVGQQEFNSILMTPPNRALSQRITVRYHIEPLNQEETGQYVDAPVEGCRQRQAGVQKSGTQRNLPFLRRHTATDQHYLRSRHADGVFQEFETH
jgi:general secretion pathway protein A